ncbi:MAG: TraR/DksA C4-type zinc finger protein [Chloroflexota bacterium]|nr:TraR/DksA C4-type zinc finger protein [Chloroflexota bacterium]
MVLTTEQQQTLRSRLEEERERLRADLQGLGDEVVALGQDQAVLGGSASNHIADHGTDVMEQEKDLVLMSNLEERLRDIDRALERMDEGTYGTCERCGKSIAPERLEALPYATLCIDCKAIVDRQRHAY